MSLLNPCQDNKPLLKKPHSLIPGRDNTSGAFSFGGSMNTQIIERGILMNAEMVRATLEGRKLKTRRPLKVQPVNYADGHILAADDTGDVKFTSSKGLSICMAVSEWIKSPFGVPGDRLYVRETWRPWHDIDGDCGCGDSCQCASKPPTPACYRASADELSDEDREAGLKWSPSIHMPRWASRILLEVVSVKVERVQEITEEDAKVEGFYCSGWAPSFHDPDNAGMHESIPAVGNFAMTWDDIYKAKGLGWDSNCWVWVVEFKRVEG